MRAVLKLELIGDDYFYHKRVKDLSPDALWQKAKRFGFNESPSWVARITGLDDKFTFKREFLKGQRDYTEANSVGSRGIFCYYPLPTGLYEVSQRITWKKTRRYFIRVEGTEIIEINRDEVIECLKNTA